MTCQRQAGGKNPPGTPGKLRPKRHSGGRVPVPCWANVGSCCRIMPRIDIPDDELAALTAAIRGLIDGDKFPRAPRLDALRAALARLDAASKASPDGSPKELRQARATSARGDNLPPTWTRAPARSYCGLAAAVFRESEHGRSGCLMPPRPPRHCFRSPRPVQSRRTPASTGTLGHGLLIILRPDALVCTRQMAANSGQARRQAACPRRTR